MGCLSVSCSFLLNIVTIPNNAKATTFVIASGDPPESLTHPVHHPKYQYIIYHHPVRGGTIGILTSLRVSIRIWRMSVSIYLGFKSPHSF